MFRAVGLYIGRARVLPRQRRHVRERAFQLRFQALSRTCLRISSSQFEKEVKPTPLLRSSRSAEIDYRAEARRLMQSSRGFSFLNQKMSQQAVFFKNYEPMEELKISVDGAKVRIRVNDSPCFGIALSPDMAREAARILNLYAVIAEGAEDER